MTARTGLFLSAALLAACAATPRESTWEPLFDGETFQGWYAYQGGELPNDAWHIEDGAIVALSGRGEIVTDASYGDFELEFSWRVSEGANSGVFYRVDEAAEQVHHVGLGYQILDNVGQGGRPLTEQAGACYGVVPASPDVTRPAGEWNSAAIEVRGDRVAHRLNGRVVAEFVLGSDAWLQAVANGPMKSHPRFGRAPSGPIALQNYHGHTVAYRDLRIRRIPDVGMFGPGRGR